MHMLSERVAVVDREDRVLRVVERKDTKDDDILRVVGVFILNEKGEILLQLRSKRSFRYPSYWDCTGGGHVSAGEEYRATAERELYEETGIRTELAFLGKHYIELDDGRRHFNAFFRGTSDERPKIDPVEVERLQSFSPDEIRDMIKEGAKIHPECLFALKRYFLDQQDR